MSNPDGGVSNNPAENKHPLPDCCGGLGNVDYSKMDLKVFDAVLKHIDFHDPSFHVAVIAIIFNPLFWNVVAMWEHRTRKLSKFFGSPYLACYFLGFVIIVLNVYRSHSMAIVMKTQASFLALGFTGTFLGIYFGIVMDEKVTSFPFNLAENPMYWGSTANYLGLALIGASPVGLVLTAIVALVYKIAIHFEGWKATLLVISGGGSPGACIERRHCLLLSRMALQSSDQDSKRLCEGPLGRCLLWQAVNKTCSQSGCLRRHQDDEADVFTSLSTART